MRRRKRRSRYRSASEEGNLTSKEVRFHQEQPEDGVHVGCVMLSKVRYRMQDPTARVPARCSLGYALRTDEDVCRCMAVTGPSECWKSEPSWRVSPEQFEPNGTGRVIAEKLAPEHL